MDDYKIKIIQSNLAEIPVSITNVDFTFELWSKYMTPWEHCRILRDLKLNYNFGNRLRPLKDDHINYVRINQELFKVKNLLHAKKRLSLSRVIQKYDKNLCYDIINIIIRNVGL